MTGDGSHESSGQFAHGLLNGRFADRFAVVRPWRYMFESRSVVVYFQNYNKRSGSLWFRLHRAPWDYLVSVDFT